MTTNATHRETSIHELFDLSGRVAIVTGGGGHLGGAMARALAEAGARVVVTSRDLNRAQHFARTLPAETAVEHFGAELNQTDPTSIDRFIDSVAQRIGQIDILINNAHEHITEDWSSVSAEDFQQHFTNLTAYFLLARHVRNHAVEHGRSASVVMLGSMYGIVGSYPDAYAGVTASPAAYHALKGGIVHLTRHLAVYWAKDGVRVNCLSPGPFPSTVANTAMVDRLITKSPMGHMGRPHELKGALLLLASDAGSYLTGQNIIVDGGWTAW